MNPAGDEANDDQDDASNASDPSLFSDAPNITLEELEADDEVIEPEPEAEPEGPYLRAAVILAAGEGSRFEGPTHKLLTEVNGKPLILWAVESALAATDCFDEVIVVSGAVDLEAVLPDAVTILHNDDWKLGQAISLQVALRYAGMHGYEAVVVALGDMPAIDPEAWKLVAREDGELVTAEYSDGQRPPVKLHADIWPLLPLGGDQGARTLMQMRPELVTAVSCPGLGLDLDTERDLQKWNSKTK